MHHTLKTAALLAAAALALGARPAEAQITWDWSFGANAGQFVTSGSAPGGTAAAGTYSLLDFSVTSSGDGATLGSVSGGQYAASGYGTTLPYAFAWNGTAVTQWQSAGFNGFDWWVFDEASNASRYFFFGWQSGNLNVASQASYYDANVGIDYPSAAVTVSAAGRSVVPEPGTWLLLGTGLVGVGGMATVRRRRAA